MGKVIKYKGKCYELDDFGYIKQLAKWDEGAEDHTERMEWRICNGDETLGVEYPLKRDSLVVEVGGYLGDWVDKVVGYYDCKVLILEPVDEYYLKLLDRFSEKTKVKVLNKGLGVRTGVEEIIREDDASRIGKGKERVYIIDAGDWFKQFKEIDLIQINCEGSEYGIFERIFETGQEVKFKNLKVQFHKTLPNSEVLRKGIRDRLEKTHRQTYNFPWVWESWERK